MEFLPILKYIIQNISLIAITENEKYYLIIFFVDIYDGKNSVKIEYYNNDIYFMNEY